MRLHAWRTSAGLCQSRGARSEGAAQLAIAGVPREVLIVVSELKAYIRARAGMSTSDGAMDMLSDIVRELCDAATRKAATEGRKTVMERGCTPVASVSLREKSTPGCAG